MMEVISLDADGYLDLLERKVRNSILKKSLRAGGKPLVAAMRREAPAMQGVHKNRIPGLLKRKIRFRSGRKAKPGTATAAVGVGEKDFNGEAFYGGFVNQGTVKMKPNAFRDRAYASAAGAAANAAAASMMEQIGTV